MKNQKVEISKVVDILWKWGCDFVLKSQSLLDEQKEETFEYKCLGEKIDLVTDLGKEIMQIGVPLDLSVKVKKIGD